MTKRRVFIVGLIGLLIVGIGVGIFMVAQNNKAKEDAQAQKDLQMAYFRQLRAFHYGPELPEMSKYMPYDDEFIHQLYRELAYYKKTTGKELIIPEIQEYLSQEFEEDGSVRIYDNGKHPEIQEYIEWRIAPRRNKEIDEYVDKLIKVLTDYEKENYFEKGLDTPFSKFSELSLAEYDELIKKEADTSYEMQFNFE